MVHHSKKQKKNRLKVGLATLVGLFIPMMGIISGCANENAGASSMNSARPKLADFTPRTWSVQGVHKLDITQQVWSTDDYGLPYPEIYSALHPNDVVPNWDTIYDKTTGWLNDSALGAPNALTYEQFFLDSNLANKIATSAGKNTGDIVKLSDLKTLSTDTLDLSKTLENDIYADDVIRTLNNPCLFPDGNEAFANVAHLDLSNNKLWHVPLFGYVSKSGEWGAWKKVGFTKLEELDLQHNHITTVSRAIDVKGKEDDSVDLTTIGKMNSETPPKPICKIKLDDNYLVQDPTNNATDLFVTYTPYAYINNIDYGEIDPATKLHKQSTALWYDRNILMNFVKDYYMQKWNIDISSYYLVDHDPIQINKILGDNVAILLCNFFIRNNIASSIVYSVQGGNDPLGIGLTMGDNHIHSYLYAQSDWMNGSMRLAFDFTDWQLYDGTSIKYSKSSQMFYSYTISGFAKSLIVRGVLIAFSVLLGLAVVFIIIYFIWIRKYLARRHKERTIREIAKSMGTK